MKLAILGARGIPARYGGFETFAEKLAIGLAKMGHEVTVFCEGNRRSADDEFQGVKLCSISAPSLGPLTTVVYDVRCLWAARKSYDVVYMLGYGAAAFCWIPRMWKTQVWINPDGLEWARAKWGWAAKRYFRLMEWTAIHAANRLIPDAAAVATSLASRHGKLPFCEVIPYGCEVVNAAPSIEPLARWQIEPAGYYLVVCRLEPENHVLEIMRAFRQSRSRRRLIVLGNHRAPTRYAEQLHSIEDPRIRLIGAVYDQEQLTSLRYHAFGYMHGHSVGGTNPSLLEAMGCGNLIFAHDNPFNREALGECGFYFANTEGLTQAIDAAEAENGALTQLRESARSRARVHYRWPDVISRYGALLEETACRARLERSAIRALERDA